MNYSVAVKTAAAAEPLTRTEAKLHLRLDVADDDALVDALIIAAREWTENYCRRSWARRTLELRLDCFAAEIKLPRGPVSSVTSIQYTDSGGSLAAVPSGDYQADLYSTPPRIRTTFGVTWPVTKTGVLNAVLIEYVAGYAPGAGSPTDYAENVPAAVKAAMKLLIGGWYQNREHIVTTPPAEVPMAVKALLAPYEIRDFSLE
jgi:uncharacterized phiE125 gp8 family phage protein